MILKDAPAGRPRSEYDEVAYRDALRVLGLIAPVECEDIHRAYRNQASRAHPDRFTTCEDREIATDRIQRINAAREYTLGHFRCFDRGQGRGLRRARSAGTDVETLVSDWQQWVLLPITAVYTLAVLLAAGPVVAFATVIGPARRARWRSSPVVCTLRPAWRVWLALAPHGVVLGLLFWLHEPAVRLWFGGSLLVMLSADLATLLTGATNSLRTHRTVHRAYGLLRAR